jgi:polyphosphate kinase
MQSPTPKLLKFFSFRFAEINMYCHQYYAAKSGDNSVPQEEIFHVLALVLKMSHGQRQFIETVLV